MAAGVQLCKQTSHFIFFALYVLCVLCNRGTSLNTPIQTTSTAFYPSSTDVSSEGEKAVFSSDISTVKLSSIASLSEEETFVITSVSESSSSGLIPKPTSAVGETVLTSPTTTEFEATPTTLSRVSTSPATVVDTLLSTLFTAAETVETKPSTTSTIVETNVTLTSSVAFNTTLISQTVEILNTYTLINGAEITSYLFYTSSDNSPGTAGLDLSINSTSKQSSTTREQSSSSIVSTDLFSNMSSAIRPSTTYLGVGSTLYMETPTVTDLVLSSSRSLWDTTSVILTSMPSTVAMTTENSLQSSTLMDSASSVVTEVISTTLTNTNPGGTLSSTLTSSTLSPKPEFSSSSDGLFTTSTTRVNTPVYNSTHHASTITTLETSSLGTSHTEHVTSRYYSSSSSSVVLAPTSSTDAGMTSSVMSVTPDPSLIAELDSLRNKVQELEDSNNGLQTAIIVLAIALAVILLIILGYIFLRRRRAAKRKKNRFAGIDADLTTPVIQRPKPSFGYRDSQDVSFGGRVSTATLEESGEMSTLGTFSTLPKTGVHNNNMDTPS
ncbi:serine-rich adhesin for platelets-like [Ylistrum balloti]|uniref:serine-rich adhesin for platelets-like n=1 Tax=Ylistrum balloti TaxID=509963 RepID=UPI0029058878|nr:serine-rich adhesin for platelets-like [Ylistrum balloti]